MDWYSRTELLIGKEGVDKLNNSKVAIFGIGGVGSYTAEALCRAGVGNLVLIDYDDICLTNLNRQIHATRKTVGKSKVDMMKERLLEINPKINVITFKELYNEETAEMLLTSDLSYVVDAIDMVSSKIDLITRSQQMNIPIISCMGAGNKFDPTKIEITDIFKTSICPLARVIRHELRKRGVKKLKVVYSKEEPVTPVETEKNCKNNCICSNKDLAKCTHRRQIPGSISFVPSAAGLALASAVVRDLLGLR
ncbi:MAG TPA: tRNA threonylcarbamoyladenosine dehydratase [Patescibacteria group bacterium]|nr:tRNA threonylcarbamoyladenosine dehydratase [Patescibacteria group bacterium]